MTTTPAEPSPDPTLVPSGDPSIDPDPADPEPVGPGGDPLPGTEPAPGFEPPPPPSPAPRP